MDDVLEVPAATDRAADAALAARIAEGDAAAFETLMRRYNRRLFRVARATLRDDAEAEDALQDAYLLAYRRIGQFRAEAALGTWLCRLVLNECLARRRRSARRQALAPIVAAPADKELDAMLPSPDESPERAAARGEVRELIERRIDALPDEFRSVFVLRSVEELSVEETAACLGVPEATVRSRHFRARGLLRASLPHELGVAERELYPFDGWRCDRLVARVLQRLARLR